MKLVWRILVLGAGLSFFGWYLSRVGLGQVWEAIEHLGSLAPLVLVPYLLVYVVDCLAWAQTLPPNHLALMTLLRIRWAGESVNNVVPSAYIGGEAVKVCLLRARGISASDGATTAVVSKTAQTLAQLAFVLAGSAVLYLLAPEQAWIRAFVLFLGLIGLAAVTALFWVQKLGFFRLVLALLRAARWRVRFVEQRQTKLLHLDEMILGFYRAHPGKFCRSAVLYLGGWMLDTIEVYLVAQLLGLPILWPQALVVESFTGIAKALGMGVPGSLGVQESGIVLVGRIAGLPDTLGATYALIRRGRELIFAAAGLFLLYTDVSLRGSVGTKPAAARIR